jgi:site-specific DNA-methyltransferase (cytosine-N4-specific)
MNRYRTVSKSGHLPRSNRRHARSTERGSALPLAIEPSSMRTAYRDKTPSLAVLRRDGRAAARRISANEVNIQREAKQNLFEWIEQAMRLWIAVECHHLKGSAYLAFAADIGVRSRSTAYQLIKLYIFRTEVLRECTSRQHFPAWETALGWIMGGSEDGSGRTGNLFLTDEWSTPTALFDYYDSIYHFDCDVASSPELAKCSRFITREQDGIKQEWRKANWLSPPLDNIRLWCKKAWEVAQRGAVVVALLPARTDTDWFRDYVCHGQIEFLQGRLTLEGGTQVAPVPYMIVVWREISARIFGQLNIRVARHRFGTSDDSDHEPPVPPPAPPLPKPAIVRKLEEHRYLKGDCRKILPTLERHSVQITISSPPYFRKRNYQVDGQIGNERTPLEYTTNLVQVCRSIREVLRPDGTLWLVLGDTRSGGGRGGYGSKQSTNRGSQGLGRLDIQGMARKQLIGIPWRVALALQADGWWLRSAIAWVKSNAMCESIDDRPTDTYEFVFLLSPNLDYYFDAGAIAENGANARNVWTFPVETYKGHHAVMPVKLAERCILAGSRRGDTVLDMFGGVASTGIAAQNLGRRAQLIEANTDYVALGEARLYENWCRLQAQR